MDQLEYAEAPTPAPGSGEVLVRVISTSINPVDYKIREGALKERMPLKFPVVLGRDVAGEVTALGAGVTKFKVGDKVMRLVNQSYAEYLVTPADALTKIPEGLDAKEAGLLPLVVTTGAAGSVGGTAVFAAKQHGAKVIAGVRGQQMGEAQSLGADFVVVLDEDGGISGLPELDAIADTSTVRRLRSCCRN